jgi:hypothetical protein
MPSGYVMCSSSRSTQVWKFRLEDKPVRSNTRDRGALAPTTPSQPVSDTSKSNPKKRPIPLLSRYGQSVRSKTSRTQGRTRPSSSKGVSPRTEAWATLDHRVEPPDSPRVTQMFHQAFEHRPRDQGQPMNLRERQGVILSAERLQDLHGRAIHRGERMRSRRVSWPHGCH